MLPRRQRLRTDRDVRGTLRVGQRRNGLNLSVRIKARTGTATRFAFVVSKQVSKRAVIRNKLRRQLRAIAKDLQIPIADVVVMARPSAARASYASLREELNQLLEPRSRAQPLR